MCSSSRAQSESVGVVLLTAVVVLAIGVVGAFVLGAPDRPETGGPLLDAGVTVTATEVEVVHGGGDAVELGALSIVVDGNGPRSRFPVDDAHVTGDGDGRFEPTETWRRDHGLADGRAELLVVHEASQTSSVLDREFVSVPTDSPPSAALSFSPSAPAPDESVTFDASDSDDETGITEYRWDWDDDGDYEASGTSATRSHSFASSGSYPVTVEVVDDGGSTDRATVTVPVGGDPSASFMAAPAAIAPGGQVTVDASGSDAGVGSIQSYEWDWTSDGTYDGSGVTRSHAYSTIGTHQITLRITNDAGQTDTDSRTIAVSEPPTASFTGPEEPETGETVTFDGSGSSDPDGTVASYDWDFDGDGSYEGTGETATHAFDSHGDHDVTLRVTDDAGVTHTETQTIHANAPPEADFTWEINSDGTLTLDAGPSTDPDGTIVSYEWGYSNTFLDADGETTTHDIDDEGTASTVNLTVTDDDELTDSVSREIPHTLDVGVPGFGTGAAMVAILVGAYARRQGYL